MVGAALGANQGQGGEANHAQAMRNVLDSLGTAAASGTQGPAGNPFFQQPMMETAKVENPVDIDAFSAFVSQ